MISTLRNNGSSVNGGSKTNNLLKYICPKCSQLLRDAVQTSCGHWLCKLCADELFTTNPAPKCLHQDCNELLKTEDSGAKYFSDVFVRKEVKKLTVNCPNNGCRWTGTLHEFESFHMQTCSYSKKTCQYCSKLLTPQQVPDHLKCCPMKFEPCPFADLGCEHTEKMSTESVHQHLTDDITHFYIIAECLKKASFSCSHVAEREITEKDSGISSSFSSLTSQDMLVERDGHGLRSVNGANPYQGRQGELMQMYLERSLAKGENFKFELDTLRAELQAKDRYLTSLQQKVAKLEKMVQGNGSQSEDRDFRLSLIENINYDGTMIWKIPQFSQRMEDARSGKYTSIFSLPFYSGRYGYKMCLRLYILGDGIGKNTHMSLFFVVMKGEFDAILQWPFTHKVSFRLINQHHGRDIVDVFQPDPLSSSFQRPKTDMNVASGCPRFISLTDLHHGGFIEDDTIFVKVKVDTTTINHY